MKKENCGRCKPFISMSPSYSDASHTYDGKLCSSTQPCINLRTVALGKVKIVQTDIVAGLHTFIAYVNPTADK